MPRVLMLGTFDTKAAEYAFLRERLLAGGCEVLAMNAGVEPLDPAGALFPIDVPAEEVAAAAGVALADLRAARDRGRAIVALSDGAALIARRMFEQGRFDGIIGMGGSGGTGIVTAAMRSLPLGVPKLCISTLAAGDISGFVGTKDILMLPSVADIAGINRISRTILSRAAGALCGMLHSSIPDGNNDRPVIAASMFGNTTKCVDACRQQLDAAGFEVLVFHATGTGGRVMESLVEEGFVDAVLDITTTEWADEVCGGILTAGPDRLSAPGRRGIPHLVVPGCIDMCNFGPLASVPARFREAGRLFYEWSPQVTLMRTSPDENRQMGEIFARKANASTGPVAFLFPRRGVSMLDEEGGRFCDRAADEAFFEAVRTHLRPGIPIIELDAAINDPAFAARAVELLRALISQRSLV